MSLCDQSILEISNRIRSGSLTVTQVLEACLEQIDARDTDLKAFVEVWPSRAREDAQRLQAELDDNHDRGLLHGIPIGIKDIVDIAGVRTRGGTDWYGENPVAEDAPLVANLKEAGAIVIGKTVTTEFAGFDPSPTFNPLDPSRTPGGSSSGSAASVAAGMCFMAVGTQTGGSINRPASYCGVAGFKPQFGTVSTNGVIPLSESLDHPGPIAKRTSDCWIGWQAMLGNKVSSDGIPAIVPPDMLTVTGDFFTQKCEQPMLDVYDSLTASLSDRGTQVESIDLPVDFEDILLMHRRIMAVEASRVHKRDFAIDPSRYSFHFRALIEEGLALTESSYQQARNFQSQVKRILSEFLTENGPLLVPATTGAAPGRESTGDPRFNSPWSFSGLPSLSFVAGADAKMFPNCLQLVGNVPSQLFSTAGFIESIILS
ncbi:MAG: amidase [Pirellulaceae bacterium]